MGPQTPQKDITSLKNQLNSCTGRIAEVLKTNVINLIDSLSNQVKTLTADIQVLVQNNADILSAKEETIKTQLQLIQTQKDLIESQKLLLQNQPSNHQPILNETIFAEEKERKRCIVIARFPESSKATPSEKIADDADQVKLLLDEMKVEAKVVETFRMGSTKESKNGKAAQPRLLKVRLQTSAQAKTILNNARNITKSTSFKDKNLLLRKSMSAEERNFESDLFIKQKKRIEELQKSNPHSEYVIYARKICIKMNNKKPEKIDDELNKLKFKNPVSTLQRTPIKNSSFQSNSSTPSGSA